MRYTLLKICITVGMVCECLALLNAQDPNAAQWVAQAKRILEIAGEEQKTADQITKAHKELSTLKPTNLSDPRLEYAFILAQLREKEKPIERAQRLSAKLLESHKNYVPARVSNARLLLLLPDMKSQAIVEIENLAKGLDSAPASVTPDQLQAAARFLGLAVGYLEGPGKESGKATNLTALIALTDKIPETLKESFSTARSAIGEEYRVLVEDGEDAHKKHLESRIKDKEDVEKKQAEMEARQKAALENAKSEKEKLENEWTNLKLKLDQLFTRYQTTEGQAFMLNNQIVQYQTEMGLLRAPIPDKQGNIDQGAQKIYATTKLQYENAIANVGFQLTPLLNTLANWRAEGTRIQTEMNLISVKGRNLGLNLAVQNQAFENNVKGLQGKVQNAAKKARPKNLNLKKFQAFSLYDDYNFYKDRTLLIDSFPAPTKEDHDQR